MPTSCPLEMKLILVTAIVLTLVICHLSVHGVQGDSAADVLVRGVREAGKLDNGVKMKTKKQLRMKTKKQKKIKNRNRKTKKSKKNKNRKVKNKKIRGKKKSNLRNYARQCDSKAVTTDCMEVNNLNFFIFMFNLYVIVNKF